MDKATTEIAMKGYHKMLKAWDTPPTPAYLVQMGKRLKHFREKRGKTLKEIGELLGTTAKYIQMQEQGRNITIVQLKRFCDALDIELKDVFK